jgi:hypothetical protein
MMPSSAMITFGSDGPVLSSPEPLPVEALLLGKPVSLAVELLPRLFNLCRTAQGLAAKLSLGLPATDDPAAEIIRDHTLKLCVIFPKALHKSPTPLPDDPRDLLGKDGLPCEPDDLLQTDPTARRIADSFPPGSAVCSNLPEPATPFAEGAFENSAAGRQSRHKLLGAIEARWGRGPLWRYAGVLADLEAALRGRLPAATVMEGLATVPAARGSYALRITQAAGVVTGITRRTPTDHLLAPGGALLQSLTTLPASLRSLAPLVIALHDPCVPITIREAQDA